MPLLTLYNSIFPKNTIDNQLLKTQMDIAKMKFKDDILQENLRAVITYEKYSIFFKEFKDDFLQENLIAVITYGKYSIFFKLL